MELKELRQADAAWRLDGYDRDIDKQNRLFFGQARQLVRDYLRRLGIGLAEDTEPLDLGWLQEVLRTRAVTYASKPVRRLQGDEGRGTELVSSALERMGFDAFLRELDVRVTLWRTALVRYYPSDASRSVVPRMFSPMAILRAPSAAEPERLDQDRAWALELADGSFEMWTRLEGGGWSMALLDKHGGRMPLSEQPFASTELVSPYPALPATLVYDGYSDRAYLPIPSHRTSYPLELAACVALIMEALVATSGPEVSYEQTADVAAPDVGPEDMPEEFGPGTRQLLPKNVTASVLQLNPQVAGAVSTIELLQTALLRAEGIDPGLFRQSQSVSAAALRVLQRPLREIQEARKPWALMAEARHWEALRAVHNVHAGVWGVDALPDGELEVQLAQLDAPMDPKELAEAYNLGRASGTHSIIDHIQAAWNVGRAEAESIFVRVQADRQVYRSQPDPEADPNLAPGPNPAAPDSVEINPGASLLDTVRAAGA